MAHTALVNQHLSDGRDGMLREVPSFSEITMDTGIPVSALPVKAKPLDERFEHIDAFWERRPRR